MKSVCEAPGFITAALNFVAIGTDFSVTTREVSAPEQMRALVEVVWAFCQG
jgi:hypothetical protein